MAGVLYLILFHGVFSLLQNPEVYRSTLSKISSNYVRTGDWNDWKIVKKDTVFVKRSANNYLNWDAAIYNCISERLYMPEDRCYGKVRAAFFPAFPLIWKFSGLSPPAMGVLNFLLFSLAIAIALSAFTHQPLAQNLVVFIVLISLPSSIVFQMPYTESLFAISMIVGCWGLWKKKYWLYFLGFALMAAVRPATVFILFAIILTDLSRSFQNKSKIAELIKLLFASGLPFLIGYLLAFGIQIYSSGNLTAFWDAHSFWSGTVPERWQIVDWSAEGFAMNVFAIFFVAIPASFLSFRYLLSDLSKPKNYLLSLALLYLTGIFIFTAITSGGNLHSFFRFELASPCFFIAAILLLKDSNGRLWRKVLLSILAPLTGFLLFMVFVDYGGDRLRFEYLGALLLILSFSYLLFQQSLKAIPKYLMLLILIAGNIVFGTYLLNMFLSNVWIFT